MVFKDHCSARNQRFVSKITVFKILKILIGVFITELRCPECFEGIYGPKVCFKVVYYPGCVLFQDEEKKGKSVKLTASSLPRVSSELARGVRTTGQNKLDQIHGKGKDELCNALLEFCPLRIISLC